VKIVYSPRLEATPRGAALISAARRKLPGVEWLYTTDKVLGTIADTVNHQGVLAVLPIQKPNWEDLTRREGIVLLFWKLQDPGNLGTILRVAAAGGAAGIILSAGSTDPYSPKVVRAAMGSLFRIPFLQNQDLNDCLQKLPAQGYRILAAEVQGGSSLWDVNFSPLTAVLFGQEGAGLHEELVAATDGVLTIPMAPTAESINVAIAAGLVIYESLRQKRPTMNG